MTVHTDQLISFHPESVDRGRVGTFPNTCPGGYGRRGTLSPEVVLEHLARNQENHGENLEIGGRGLFIIWRFLDTLLIRINPGRQTVIGGRISLSSADMIPENKGFHIITGH